MAIRLGFIGFGIMGERLLRAAIQHDPAVLSVSGIFDPGVAAATRLRLIDPDRKVFESADAVIMASDCVHIASPPSSHLDYLARCIAMGKAALCEKPLATDVAAAREVVAGLGRGAIRAAVNFVFPSSFAVDHLQNWIREGVIGSPQRLDIDLAFAQWPRSWQVDASGWLDGRDEGGFTREVASHFLFLSQRLLGDVTLHDAVAEFPSAVRSERAISAGLTAGGIPGMLTGAIGTTNEDDVNTWQLTGSAGRMRLRNWSIAEREVDGRWVPAPDALPNEKIRPLVLARHLDKVAAMTRGEKTNLASLAEALAVQELVESILAAPAQGDRRPSLPA